jgi:hypothetical protein
MGWHDHGIDDGPCPLLGQKGRSHDPANHGTLEQSTALFDRLHIPFVIAHAHAPPQSHPHGSQLEYVRQTSKSSRAL